MRSSRTPAMELRTFALLLCLLLSAQALNSDRGCPTPCYCERDGALLRVDCSDRGLSALPHNLSALTSYLDLSMNNITNLPVNALHKLRFLKELMLQNNQLREVPSEVFLGLHSLQSLRLDANHINILQPNCFDGLVALRHLWLDDNSLIEIPVQSLKRLSALQAMTLALNKIQHIPDHAFGNLSSLVVLHLHNNRIDSMGNKCFDGLHSLETLDLNHNNLDFFPSAISTLTNLKELGFHSNNIKSIPEQAFVGNPFLITIHFYDNPIQSVGKSAFQRLPDLRTLTLNGASQLTEFPDLNGTTSLESLTLTGAQIASVPSSVCDQLPNLQVLDLAYNRIEDVPSIADCRKLQKIVLRHNRIHEITNYMFKHLNALRFLDLAWNKIAIIHPNSFTSLPSLTRLDLSWNHLSSFPDTGLHGLTHLKLTGNYELLNLIPADHFSKLKVIEMAYAYQCCAFGVCESTLKVPSQWSKDDNSTKDTLNSGNIGMVHIQGMMSSSMETELSLNQVSISPTMGQFFDERDFEDFLVDFDEELKLHHSVQCSPPPGPFKPCKFLFGSWFLRIGVWTVVILAVVCNALVISTVFNSFVYGSSIKLLIGVIASVNLLMGLSSGVLACLDVLTFGSFALYGAWWESGVGCQITGFISIFASEASVFLLTVAALERGYSVKCAAKLETKSTLVCVKLSILACFILALGIALVPPLTFSQYAISPLCLPLPFGDHSAMSLIVALVLLNSLCFLLMTVSYTKLYCSLEKGDLENAWDCSMVKHIGFLLFANCIQYCPVAFLSVCSLLNLTFISPEVVKSVLLVAVPLPACLNPLHYILFNPHFKEDLESLRNKTQLWKTSNQRSLISVNSEYAEKQSCDSTQALITFSSGNLSYDLTVSLSKMSSYQMTENSKLSEMSPVPCR
ncbi:leucine-rich repeat-containing G-protein coupled receptor 5 isoform X2 [Pleurodeles waltl]|uniref:leucine-rich repeat-containing G-protein coupled receptor 5 isoform X2 n=1 Tax=Pleurodeles waltl TaxID=8319 RepID=UPI0037099219